MKADRVIRRYKGPRSACEVENQTRPPASVGRALGRTGSPLWNPQLNPRFISPADANATDRRLAVPLPGRCKLDACVSMRQPQLNGSR